MFGSAEYLKFGFFWILFKTAKWPKNKRDHMILDDE